MCFPSYRGCKTLFCNEQQRKRNEDTRKEGVSRDGTYIRDLLNSTSNC